MTDLPPGAAAQPIATVTWRRRDELSANAWNPNRQAPPEHRLLKVSILESGWTQPIVARREANGLEIVDGYHRWLVAADPEIAALTGGLVPVVELLETDPAMARMSTIRHNRARGVHHVIRMADIVAELVDLGLTPEEIGRRLQMDEVEVDRLLDRGQMTKRGSGTEFNKGWAV